MLSHRLWSPVVRAGRLAAARRAMSSGAKVEPVSQARQTLDLANFDPNNYSVPVRQLTMYDTMEPYGSWKTAYEAERKRANGILFRGIACFATACIVVVIAGVFDGVIMPNLDNIMEETEPFEFEKSEDRICV